MHKPPVERDFDKRECQSRVNRKFAVELLARYGYGRVCRTHFHNETTEYTPDLSSTIPIPIEYHELVPYRLVSAKNEDGNVENKDTHIENGSIPIHPINLWKTEPPSNTAVNNNGQPTADLTAKISYAIDPKDPPSLQSSAINVLAGIEGLYLSQRDLSNALSNIRDKNSADSLLMLPHQSLPHRYAILAYGGVDLFDASAIIEASTNRQFLSSNGAWPIEDIGSDLCDCRYCKNDDLLGHNLLTASKECAWIRWSIKKGEMRSHLETRTASDPWGASMLSLLDSTIYSSIEKNIPLFPTTLQAAHPHALSWPEIKRYTDRIKSRYYPPNINGKKPSILLILPCSARKPYSRSRSHRNIKDALFNAGTSNIVHEVIVTSPLGLVPRELETYPPVVQYDTAVTGDWSYDEQKLATDLLLDLLKKGGYENIIIHLPGSYSFVKEFLDEIYADGATEELGGLDITPKIYKTCIGGINSSESISLLSKTLSQLKNDRTAPSQNSSPSSKPRPRLSPRERMKADMMSRARFQFDIAGERLLEDAVVKGRYPNQRILVDNEQTGMLTGDRGVISLGILGGKRLAEADAYTVEIEDFQLKGDIFAGGVISASDDIRIGDDVVIVHDQELRGVGIAVMTAKDMTELNRGLAVKTRTKAKHE